MQTKFSPEQLATPRIKLADEILRKCVHCGFCTATCPTYVLLGDELDSPRGRIYLIKEMFEGGKKAGAETTKHLDRCLTCLSCMTTCPSGVHYMHLVDEARAYVEETHQRGLLDRLMRSVLANILPYPKRFAFALNAARLAKPFAGLFGFYKPLKAMLGMVPGKLDKPGPLSQAGVHSSEQKPVGRVALLTGCANSVLEPSINEATVRVLNRAGVEVVIPPTVGCCGAMEHHLGREHETHAKVKTNVDAWMAEIEGKGLDAIIINASGCGTTVKDYGHMLRLDADYADKAKTVSDLTRDITEYLADIEIGNFSNPQALRVTYHSACSMQHGQKIKSLPQQLLGDAGFEVVDVPEGHLCCGSAGVYNIMQSELADKLKTRKLANIAKTSPQIIAAGNIGCITQLASGTDVPVIHTIELLDWAQGGPKPGKMRL